MANVQPNGPGYSATPTASTLAEWDSNKNLTANSFISQTTSTATAGGTTTMDITYTQVQVWTGSSAQTVKLPTTSVAVGQSYTIINQSTGDVTVQSSAANTLNIIKGGASPGGTAVVYTAKIATPTSDLHWYSTALQGARLNTITSSATPSININTTDIFTITALAANITSVTVTGAPVDGQYLMVRIKGTNSQTIAWGASFASSGVAQLITTTVAAKTHHIGFIYDAVTAVWQAIAVDLAGY